MVPTQIRIARNLLACHRQTAIFTVI